MTGFELLKLATTLAGTELNTQLIDPTWHASVSPPMDFNGQVVPGYQQFDNVDLGMHDYLWKDLHPDTTFLRKNNYRVPDITGLPGGRYYAGNAANEAWRRHMQSMGRPLPADQGLTAMEGALSLTSKPSPSLSGVDKLDMSRVLKSWGRNQAKVDPVYHQAFRAFNRPQNAKWLGMIGTGLKSLL